MMMSKLFSAALLSMGLVGATMAQQAPKSYVSQQPAVTVPLSAGTAINASLVGALDSTRCKPGDPVEAVVTEPVIYQRSTLLPKGSRIVGHVVRTGADTEQGSALFVEFNRVILPNGQEAVLNAGIQALAPPNAKPTIPSRKEYEEDRIAGTIQSQAPVPEPTADNGTIVLPSTYTTPRRSVAPDLPTQQIEGGLDRHGKFTPDSKGAFAESNMRIFTPVSEGSHGTVLIGAKSSVRLDNGTHLLIVIQPPATAPAN